MVAKRQEETLVLHGSNKSGLSAKSATGSIPDPFPARTRTNLVHPQPHSIVDVILEGWRRGARRPLPALRALRRLNAPALIEREGPLGWRALSQALRIRGGRARGLMERLAGSKLGSVTDPGVQLSKLGKQ